MARKLKVLVVDQSPTVQALLAKIINSDKNMVVVGLASDPYVAREKIKTLEPDVLTLDVSLPKMDGITFLRNLMRLRPMPVLMVIDDNAESKALSEIAQKIGAKDVFIKQPLLAGSPKERSVMVLLGKIRTAAGSHVEEEAPILDSGRYSADVILKYTEPALFRSANTLIAIGASTGGTEAIRKVLVKLPADMPAIVVTQHIPGNFSAAFAERIDRLTTLNVAEVKGGEQILPGHVYIAPGDRHFVVESKGSDYFCVLHDGPRVNRHKPSVDVLFRSVAQCAGPNGIGVLLTGMGDDGACGLLEMKNARAPTIVQDEKSSVVWGMPGSAVKLGAADEVVPLDQIPEKLMGKLKTQESTDKVKELAGLRRFKG